MRSKEHRLKITGVQPGEMPLVWEHVEGHFNSFAARAEGEISAGQLLHQVLQSQRQCWVAINEDGEIVASALTQILDNPKKTLELTFCAGRNRHDWRDDMIAELEAWARHMGSRRLRIVCRPGWTRELKALGYRETHRVVERDL